MRRRWGLSICWCGCCGSRGSWRSSRCCTRRRALKLVGGEAVALDAAVGNLALDAAVGNLALLLKDEGELKEAELVMN